MKPPGHPGWLTPLSGAAGARPGDGEQRHVFDRVRATRQACRQLFGIPDYERYLAHAAVRHPGAPVLSRREFFAQAIERKYGKRGPRCC